MAVVLGIDAAWTLTQPSGVALIVKEGAGWRLAVASPSYKHFHDHAAGGHTLSGHPSGTRPSASALLASSLTLCGLAVDLVAVDMPLSRGPIIGRRASDNAVSRVYGARKCGTHSPSAIRPGPISDELRSEFDRAGYPLQTDSISPPGLIEVYPHPALVELANAPERLRYKLSKCRNYWPTSAPPERRTFLFQEWARIIALLEQQITGVANAMPPPATNARLVEFKAYEDMLDAIVCGWVAIRAWEGRAKPFGDHESAIWIPQAELIAGFAG